MIFLYLLGLVGHVSSMSTFYDTYTGKVITNEEVRQHIRRNTTFWCVAEILPCDPTEGRRVDGSCNNLKHPSRGAPHTPTYRLLPAEYSKDFEPRRCKSGEPLPLSRSVRTNVLAEGRVPNSKLTQLLTHFWVFTVGDVVSVHDTVNYVRWKPYCCEERGKTDRECTPNIIPNDDPTHRFSSIRCMNLTRPFSFQSVGCLRKDTVPERIVTASPTFDLSHVYGGSLKILNEKSRLFINGMLKYEVENNKIWPPRARAMENLCLSNELPHETRCHDTPEGSSNSILGINLFTIWKWRFHNHITTLLSLLNPCWSDDKLFFTTRDIVIAIFIQIYYYEFMPVIMGYDNLIKDGIISQNKGFRDIYDEDILPQISLEFLSVQRWGHTLQEGKLKMYDAHGHYLKEQKIVNLTLRTGYLVDHLEHITQGAYRQPAAKFGYIVDPDMAETSIGGLQLSSDVFVSDLTKNRFYGFPGYIKYRELCTGKTYKTFKDLLDVIDPERIELLKEKYKHVEDIDLLAGIWLERAVSDGSVPVTVYCINAKQLLKSVVSDRHWYERPNRPNAFTLEQLLEVRKASVAQFMCAVGDTVTEIQPKPFYLSGKGNEIRSCKKIQKVNLWPWKDSKCAKQADTKDFEF